MCIGCAALACQTVFAISWGCVQTGDFTKHIYISAPNIAIVLIAITTIITITITTTPAIDFLKILLKS